MDGGIALVGLANMDRRSPQLHVENKLLIDDAAVTAAIRQRQLGYLSAPRPVAADTVRAWPLGRRLLQNAIGMMARQCCARCDSALASESK